MKIRKAIKKIAAIGAGAVMVGATIMGAMAYDLGTYPSPFISDGVLDAVLVYGDAAAASDSAALLDIAVGLQAVIGGSGETEVDVADGYKVETASTSLTLNDALDDVKKSALDDDDLSVLAEGEISDENGKDYTYKLKLDVGNATIEFNNDWDDGKGEIEDPVVALDWVPNAESSYVMTLEFPTAIENLTTVADEELVLFGKTVTFAGDTDELNLNQTTPEFCLYAAAVDKTFNAGESTTVAVGNQSVSVTVAGVNTEDNKATITINGESKSVEEEHSYSVGGQRIYVKDVFAYTVPVANGAVRLYLGADKIKIIDGEEVQIGTGEDDLDGVVADITKSGGSNSLKRVTFTVTPADFDNETEYLADGQVLVDPLFGGLQFMYEGSNLPMNSSARELIKVEPTGDDARLTFTNDDGTEYSFKAFHCNDSNVSSLIYNKDSDALLVTDGGELGKNDHVIVTDDAGTTRILKLSKITDTDNEADNGTITLTDVGTNEKVVEDEEFTKGNATIYVDDGTYLITNANADNENLTITASTDGSIGPIFTEHGAYITLNLMDSWNGTQFVYEGDSYVRFAEINSTKFVINDDIADDAINWTIDIHCQVDDSSDAVTVAVNNLTSGLMKSFESDDDLQLALTPAGTYIEENTETYKVEIYYAGDEVVYDVYVAPTGSAVTKTTSTGTIDTGRVMAASTAVTAGQNVIAAGGACVNPVAVELMGDSADCNAGFEEGKAMIKSFDKSDGKVAILVAGYTATDTSRAAKVLKDYASYDLSGSEVEVITVTETVTITASE